MMNFDATRADGLGLQCFYCGREIAGGNWFARIKVGNERVGFCRPNCLESFLMHRDHAAGAAALEGMPLAALELTR